MNSKDVSPQDQIIQQTNLCHDGFFQLKKYRIQYKKFDGTNSRPHHREVLVREPTVAVLVYDDNNKTILLTEQFRIGPLENNHHPWLFELPAGIVEKNEDKKKAAKREVFEETGYRCNKLSSIGEFYLSPGGSNEVTTLFSTEITLDDDGIHGAADENEDIKTHIVTFDTAYKMLQQRHLSAITAIAILWLKNQENVLC